MEKKNGTVSDFMTHQGEIIRENDEKEKLLSAYPFLYETHLHTKEGSACAHNTAAEMAVAYKEAGYAGIMVTDHFYQGNTAVDRKLPWEEWVEAYCKGYENAKKVGDEIGLSVFFGWETSYPGADFLIYGLDKEWLLAYPEIKEATIQEQYRLVHESGGMVIHAHPFREAASTPNFRLYPDCVDGVEVVNAAHIRSDKIGENGRPLYDIMAQEYAGEHWLPMTGGSDMHSADLLGAGMAFAERLESVFDYIDAVKMRTGQILLPRSR